jgi:hypothetical protein
VTVEREKTLESALTRLSKGDVDVTPIAREAVTLVAQDYVVARMAELSEDSGARA